METPIEPLSTENDEFLDETPPSKDIKSVEPIKESKEPIKKFEEVSKVRKPTPISKAEADAKAEQAKQARKLPLVPGWNADFAQLSRWLQPLTEDQWSHVAIYMYRKWPVIIRRQGNPDADTVYIDIISKEHVDKGLLQYIKTTHGGGRYKFLVNDTDERTPRGSKGLMDVSLYIPIDECMPILNLAELDRSHKDNLGYLNILIAKGIIDTKGNIVQPTATVISDTSGSTAAMAEMSKSFLTMFAQLNKDQQTMITSMLSGKENKSTDITALLLEKLKQDNPNNQITLMTTLITAMKEMIPKPVPIPDNSGQTIQLFERLMASQAENNKFQLETMKQLMEVTSRRDEGDSWIDKVLKYREAIPGLFGGGEGSREGKRSTPEIIVDAVKDIGLPVIGLVSQIIQTRTGARPIVPVTPGQAEELVNQYQPMSGEVRQPPPSQRKVIAMPEQPSSQPGQGVGTGVTGIDPNNITMTQKLLMQFGGMLINAIKGGMDGFELAERLSDMTPLMGGQDIYVLLRNQGREEILKTMRGIPEFWEQTGKQLGDAYMEKLVDDFITWHDLPEDEGPEGA